MQVALLEYGPKPEWRTGLDALASQLASTPQWTVTREDIAADAWLISAGDSNEYARLLAGRGRDQLRRTVLLGVDLVWQQGARKHRPGSLPELLETNRLAGAFTPRALLAWRDLPSYFAGPNDLMGQFQTNGISAMQSEHYSFWGCAPGGSLAAFLIDYLPVLVAHVRAE